MRFYKLVSGDINSNKIAVVNPSKIPVDDVLLLLKLKPTGEVEFAKLPALQAYMEIRKYYKAIVSRNGDFVLIVVAM